MAKYSTEFKIKAVKEYLESIIEYKYLSAKYCIHDKSILRKWVIDPREKGIEGLKSKKIGRPSEMSKSPKKSKYTKVESLTQAQLKEKINKLEEKNYWLQLENDAIKKDRIISNDRYRNKEIAETIEVLIDKYKLKDLLKYFNIPKSKYKRLNKSNKDI